MQLQQEVGPNWSEALASPQLQYSLVLKLYDA